MRKKKGNTKFFKSAEAGISTLILFIAFVLVAAISASVLISTGGSLQNKALATGTQTQKSVSSGISIMSIYGENASVSPEIEYLYATIRLAPGSDPIQFNGSTIDVLTGANSQAYKFNQSGDCSIDWLSNVSVSLHYYAAEGKDGYSMPGVLRLGDVVTLCTRLSVPATERTKITWQFTPKSGVFTKIKTETPAVMASAKIFLYP